MEKHIVVIGAGASGIAAASKLMDNHFGNVTILEAEPRIGGRVKTVPFGESFIDMGAQWCHGQRDNVVYETVKDMDLLEPSVALTYDEVNFIQSDGTEIPAATGKKLLKLIEVMDQESVDECRDGSHGSLVVANYAEAIKKDEYKDIDPELAAQCLQSLHAYYRSMNAADSWFDASCPGYVDGRLSEGDQLLNWKGGKGYKTVLDVLMKKIPNPSEALPVESRVQLNKPVRTVFWSTPKPVVECEDGTQIEADHVICTVSLGVLRARHQSMFSPELPLPKRNAIEGLKLGSVNKIFLEFERAFWPEKWAGFNFLWRDADLDEIRANPLEQWVEFLGNVSTVQYHPNLLCGWIAGPGSREMELRSDEEVKRVMMKWMRRCLKSFVVTEPVTIIRSNWSSEPNFLGSYSYMSIVGDDLKSSRADLAAPVLNESGVPVVQFAGEASELQHFATVHGAIETGWREANRLIDLYSTGAN